MHPKTVLTLLMIVGGAFMGVQALKQLPVAAATSMDEVFVGPGSAADAKKVAAWLDALADDIEVDGELDNPQLKTNLDVEELRVRASQFITYKLAKSYKDTPFAEIAEAFLTSKVGQETGELTPTQRKAWAQAYRELADSCRAAAGGW